MLPSAGHSGILLKLAAEDAAGEGVEAQGHRFTGKAGRMFKAIRGKCMADGGDEETCTARAAKIVNAKAGEAVKPAPRRPTRVLIEASGIREGSRVEGDWIRNVHLVGLRSKNGYGYGRAALAEAAPKYEGLQFFLDHAPGGEARSVRDLAGVVHNPRLAEDGLRGDVKVIPDLESGRILRAIAENAPRAAGPSHYADVHFDEGEKEVVEIETAYSVDLVTSPATTGGIFESAKADGAQPMKTLAEFLKENPEAAREHAAALDARAAEETRLRKAAEAEVATARSARFLEEALAAAADLPKQTAARVRKAAEGRTLTAESAKALVEEEATYARSFRSEDGATVVEDGGRGETRLTDEGRKAIREVAAVEISKMVGVEERDAIDREERREITGTLIWKSGDRKVA